VNHHFLRSQSAKGWICRRDGLRNAPTKFQEAELAPERPGKAEPASAKSAKQGQHSSHLPRANGGKSRKKSSFLNIPERLNIDGSPAHFSVPAMRKNSATWVPRTRFSKLAQCGGFAEKSLPRELVLAKSHVVGREGVKSQHLTFRSTLAHMEPCWGCVSVR
jgi:hypothetical protein